MATDLTIRLEDRPGTVAAALEAVGGVGINIEGGYGNAREGVFHILVDDVEGARQALEAAGFTAGDEREVLVLGIEDRPGAAGAVFRRIADAGVNLEFVYVATNNRLVIASNNIEQARAAVQ